jgi:signal transduction histidine kinase
MIEMEEQVRRQERLATVGSLAAGIAHEIRNPLAALSGSVQVLRGEIELKEDNKRLMDIIVRETDRLNTIITGFLEYARPKTTLTERIDLKLMLDETIMLIKNSRAYGDSIRINVVVDATIALTGDAQRLRQVFWNLLINSCQAMPGGGTIAISAVPFSFVDDDTVWCELNVSDTGQGIAREYLGKIFDPFFTTKTGGTGLGLAIVYRIIEEHGGTISVESELGRGTSIKIRLPMVESTGLAGVTNNKQQGRSRKAIH